MLGYGILSILFALISAFLPIHYFERSIFIVFILAIIYLLVGYLLCSKIKPKYLVIFRKVCFIGLWMFVFQLLIVTGVKMVWGRERYRICIQTQCHLHHGLAHKVLLLTMNSCLPFWT